MNQHGKLRVIPTRDGKAWDIAFILDGGYASREDAEDVAAYLASQLAKVRTASRSYTPPPGSTIVGQFTDGNGNLHDLTIPPGAWTS